MLLQAAGNPDPELLPEIPWDDDPWDAFLADDDQCDPLPEPGDFRFDLGDDPNCEWDGDFNVTQHMPIPCGEVC